MKKIIRAVLLIVIIFTGFMGFFYMNQVGLDGKVDLAGSLQVSPMMLILTSVFLALVLLTNIFAWIAIFAAVVLLVIYYAFGKTIITGQQMMAIYLLVFGVVDIWISHKD